MADQQQFTVEDLGRAVKAQNPGAYDDVPDADLGRAKKQKHPEAYADFADVQPTPSHPLKSFGHGVMDSLLGAAQGIAHNVVPAPILRALGMHDTPSDLLPMDAEGNAHMDPPSAALNPLIALFKQDPARAVGQLTLPVVSGVAQGTPPLMKAVDESTGASVLRSLFGDAPPDVLAARSKMIPKAVRDRLEFFQKAREFSKTQDAARKLGVDIRSEYGPQIPEGGVPPAPVYGPHELEPGVQGPGYQPPQTTPYPAGKGTGTKYGGPKAPEYGPARPNGASDSWEAPAGPLTPQGQAAAEAAQPLETQAPTPFKPNPNIRRLIKPGGRANTQAGPGAGSGTPVNPNSAYRQRVLERLNLSTDADAMPAGKAEGQATTAAQPDDIYTQQSKGKMDEYRQSSINKDAVTEVYAIKKQGLTGSQLDAITGNDASFKSWVQQLNEHNGTHYKATPEFKARVIKILRPKLKD